MRPAMIEPILNAAPRVEVEIYRELILRVYAQLGILTDYDKKFLFLREQMHIHLLQLGATIDAMKDRDDANELTEH